MPPGVLFFYKSTEGERTPPTCFSFIQTPWHGAIAYPNLLLAQCVHFARSGKGNLTWRSVESKRLLVHLISLGFVLSLNPTPSVQNYKIFWLCIDTPFLICI
jgi:hypothetical protein